jgi:hypothetical protein
MAASVPPSVARIPPPKKWLEDQLGVRGTTPIDQRPSG